MSECNYCLFERIKRQAKRGRKRVIMRQGAWKQNGLPTGIDVYVVPIGPRIRSDRIEKIRSVRERYWVSWFMALTDHCVC